MTSYHLATIFDSQFVDPVTGGVTQYQRSNHASAAGTGDMRNERQEIEIIQCRDFLHFGALSLLVLVMLGISERVPLGWPGDHSHFLFGHPVSTQSILFLATCSIWMQISENGNLQRVRRGLLSSTTMC